MFCFYGRNYRRNTPLRRAKAKQSFIFGADWQQRGNNPEGDAKSVATTKIYAQTRMLAYGEPLTEEDIALIDYAVEFVPEGSFATIEDGVPRRR